VGVSGSYGTFHVSVSIDAWHGFALLGLLIAFAAMILWALMRFASVKLPTMQVAWEIVIPAAAALGTVLVAIRGLTYSGTSLKIGFFLLIIAGGVFIASTYEASRSGAATPGV
jgi:hypothetical protein